MYSHEERLLHSNCRPPIICDLIPLALLQACGVIEWPCDRRASYGRMSDLV